MKVDETKGRYYKLPVTLIEKLEVEFQETKVPTNTKVVDILEEYFTKKEGVKSET